MHRHNGFVDFELFFLLHHPLVFIFYHVVAFAVFDRYVLRSFFTELVATCLSGLIAPPRFRAALHRRLQMIDGAVFYTREDAQHHRDTATNLLADIADSSELVIRVSVAADALLPRAALRDRRHIRRELASARTLAAEAFETNAKLAIDQPTAFDADAEELTDFRYRQIVEAYQGVETLAQRAFNTFEDLGVFCDSLRSTLDQARPDLDAAEVLFGETETAIGSFQEDGFVLDLSWRLAQAQTRLRRARTVLGEGKDGLALHLAAKATASCRRMVAAMEEIRTRSAELTDQAASLISLIRTRTTDVETAILQVARIVRLYGPDSIKDLSGAAELNAMLTGACELHERALALIAKQEWAGTEEALTDARQMLDRLRQCITALTDEQEKLNRLFRTCEAAMENVLKTAEFIRTRVEYRTGDHGTFRTRIDDVVRRVAATRRQLASPHPDFPSIDDELAACRSELAAIDTASLAVHRPH